MHRLREHPRINLVLRRNVPAQFVLGIDVEIRNPAVFMTGWQHPRARLVYVQGGNIIIRALVIVRSMARLWYANAPVGIE